MKTTRSLGVVASVELSLGHDVSYRRVEQSLLSAVERAGLVEGFVQILELGNFAIINRVSGMLSESRYLIFTCSEFYGL